MSSSLSLVTKQEPVSPSSSVEESTWISDDLNIYWTSDYDSNETAESETVYESKAEAATKLLEDLEHLEDLDELIKYGE